MFLEFINFDMSVKVCSLEKYLFFGDFERSIFNVNKINKIKNFFNDFFFVYKTEINFKNVII